MIYNSIREFYFQINHTCVQGCDTEKKSNWFQMWKCIIQYFASYFMHIPLYFYFEWAMCPVMVI